MSEKLRNGLIRVALISMFGCYYAGGLVADSRSNAAPAEFAASADLQLDLEQRLSAWGPMAWERAAQTCLLTAEPEERAWLSERAAMVNLIDAELQRRGDSPQFDSSKNHGFSQDSAAMLQAHRDTGAKQPLDLPLASVCFQNSLDRLRADIYSTRYDTQNQYLAGCCASLALLANHCRNDSLCQPDDADSSWPLLCDSLRSAMHELNQACHTGSQTKAAAALQRSEWALAEWQAAASSVD